MNLINHFDDLYLLTRVIEARGFSAAAQQTGIPRSRLSRRIIELEQQLGARLLHRNARRFSVTPLGEQVYRQALAMRVAAEAVESVVQEATHMPSGLVRVDISALLMGIIPSALATFAAETGIQLTMVQKGGVSALLEQHADLVFVLGSSLPNNGDVVARKLGYVRMVTVASPQLLAHREALKHSSQLQQWPCLGYTDNSGNYSWRLKDMPHGPRCASLADNLPALVGAACAGLGVAQLPLYACRDEINEGRLQVVLDTFESPPWPLYALTLSSRAVNQAVRSLLEFCRAHLNQCSQENSAWLLPA